MSALTQFNCEHCYYVASSKFGLLSHQKKHIDMKTKGTVARKNAVTLNDDGLQVFRCSGCHKESRYFASHAKHIKSCAKLLAHIKRKESETERVQLSQSSRDTVIQPTVAEPVVETVVQSVGVEVKKLRVPEEQKVIAVKHVEHPPLPIPVKHVEHSSLPSPVPSIQVEVPAALPKEMVIEKSRFGVMEFSGACLPLPEDVVPFRRIGVFRETMEHIEEALKLRKPPI